MSDYLNKTGIPNIENTIFRKLNNKYNHLPSQEYGTTIPTNSSNDSLYSIKNVSGTSELFFNGQQLTTGGGISSNVWEVDADDNTQVITLNNKNVSINGLDLKDISYAIFNTQGATTTDKKLYVYNNGIYFGDVQLDSPHTTSYWTLTGATLTPNGSYNLSLEVASVKHNLTGVDALQASSITMTGGTQNINSVNNINVDTISMSGSTRVISNLEGINFTGVSKYITGLNSLTFTGTGSSLQNCDDGYITDLYSTYVSTNQLWGRNTLPTGDYYVEMPNGHFLFSKEIRNNNSGGTAKIYSDEYYIGTPLSNFTLADYIVGQIGTHSNETLQNLWVYPQPIYYKQLELVGGSAPYTDSGLKTDVLIIDKYADIETLYCHQFTTASAGSSVFDFFDTAGNLLWNAGEAYSKYKLAQKMLKFGGAVALTAIGLSIAGNIIYNVAQGASTPDYLGQADEYGCSDGFNQEYNILSNTGVGLNPIGHPDNDKTIYTFAFNAGYGRLVSAGYGQTETAQTILDNPTEFVVYSMINGHDPQRSMSFHDYTSVADWNNAKIALNGAGLRMDGSNQYALVRRLVSIQDGGGIPRLRYNGSSNILAYKSEIDAQSYWEINSGNLQPNSNSGLQGLLQINSGAINAYRDLYMVGTNINFNSATKGRIAYDDSLKTLSFRNGDNNGEFKFLDYNNISQFNIDTTNNRLEIPNYDLFFQNSFDQKINKVGSTNLIFEMNSQPILTLKNPPSIWAVGFEYPVSTFQDTRLSTSGGVNHTSTTIELFSPNSTGTLYITSDNGVDGDYSNVFYSRRRGATTGNQYNIFMDVPKTKVNSLQFTPISVGSLLNNGLEFTQDFATNDLMWYGDKVLTDNAPNISNKLTFDSITLTNSGLERNGTDIYWNGSKLNNQSSGSSYFTDNGTTATSSALDFSFVQAVNVDGNFTANSQIIGLGQVSGGGNNLVMNVGTSGSSYITINHGKRFLNYDTAGTYISNQSGLDSQHNIQFQLHASPTTYFKIDDTNSTFYTNVVLDNGKDLSLLNGDITLQTTGNLTLQAGDLNLWNGNAIIGGYGVFSGNVDTNSNVIVRSSNITTNYLNISMDSDITATYKLTGGSNPTSHIFKDYNNNNIFIGGRDDFLIYNSSGNNTFRMQSANCSIYNPLDVNDVYCRSGATLNIGHAGTSVMNIPNTSSVVIPTADLYLTQGSNSTTDDSNAIHLGKWRIKQRIVPNVEFQALRFEFDVATGGKGGYILRSRNDAVITFTGQHKNAVEETAGFTLKKGMILSSTGVIRNFNEEDVITISEALPILKPSSKKCDKGVYGIYTGDTKRVNQYIQGSFGTECEPLIDDPRRCLINSTGEGAVLVGAENGNIEVGDLICSSSKRGIGMKQDDDIIRSYTVCKATTAHNFKEQGEEVLIGCLYLL